MKLPEVLWLGYSWGGISEAVVRSCDILAIVEHSNLKMRGAHLYCSGSFFIDSIAAVLSAAFLFIMPKNMKLNSSKTVT